MVPHNQTNKPLMQTAKQANLKNVMSGRDGKHEKYMLSVSIPPAIQETWVRSLGWEDSLEKGMATHSSILAWKITWSEYPWGHKEVDTTE